MFMNTMSKWCRVLPLAVLFAFLLGLLAAAQAPTPTSIPNGLPSWAYNIPDKDHPPPARVSGMIRVPGSANEYERMAPIAKAVSDEDVRAAADYFAAIKPIPWVKVIETVTPPKTYVSIDARHRVLDPSGGTEPIGHRIIETPVDPAETSIRD